MLSLFAGSDRSLYGKERNVNKIQSVKRSYGNSKFNIFLIITTVSTDLEHWEVLFFCSWQCQDKRDTHKYCGSLKAIFQKVLMQPALTKRTFLRWIAWKLFPSWQLQFSPVGSVLTGVWTVLDEVSQCLLHSSGFAVNLLVKLKWRLTLDQFELVVFDQLS